MLPSVLPRITTHSAVRVFLVFGNFSQDSLPGTELSPYLFCLFFVSYIFSYLLSKTMGCFSGCLMSFASIQKLFCGIYSV